MAHYYAFCESHKKCGPNRQTKQEAWEDVDAHLENVSGPHGRVFVKLSNFSIDSNGRKKFNYKSIITR